MIEIKVEEASSFDKNELLKISNKRKIQDLKDFLKDTDYMILKYMEGELSESDFNIVKLSRAEARAEINKLEESLL